LFLQRGRDGRRNTMKKALVAGALGLGFLIGSAGAASAVSPSEQQCEASGGEFTRTNGSVSCVTSDPVGNSENSGGKSQTRDTDEGGQGNLSNKETCTASGPGNQTRGC
jgi:hypothetical protein